MIEPTVGRVVWYWPEKDEHGPDPQGQPFAASIAHVNEDGTVNLGALNAAGVSFGRTNVRLVQDNGVHPDRPYAEWMPYQRGQAARTEALEKAAAAPPAPAPAPEAPPQPAPEPPLQAAPAAAPAPAAPPPA